MIIGHQKQWQFLKKSAELGRLSHAYLFSGDEKLGKKKLAFEFISFLFGQTVHQLVAGGHPDFVFIKPIEREIQISQIRELISRLSLKNFSAPLKAAIIDKAHLMNLQAQNCFLKTLEEPRGDTILILITEHPNLLLPTIVSRCQQIKFYPLREKEIEKELIARGAQKEMAKELAEISLGRPGLAIDFLSDSKKIKEYKKIISDLIKIFNSDLSFRFQYVKSISQDSMEILKIWLFYLRKILRAKLRGEKDENSQNFSLSKLKNIIEFLERIIFLISTKNINPRLALENLMLEL